MGTDMIAPTESGMFEGIYDRRDAEKRPLMRAKIDGSTYDINATVFRGTERMRTNAYLMAQQKFCTQLSDLACCQNEKLEYEITMGQILNGTVGDLEKVFAKSIGEQEDLMKNYIKSLERKVAQVHGVVRNQGTNDLMNAFAAVERIRRPKLDLQAQHRERYFDLIYQECTAFSNSLNRAQEQPAVEPSRIQERSKKVHVNPSGEPNPQKLVKPIIREVERIREVQLQPPAPVPVEPSTPIEISATRKPAKPKSHPKPKTDAQIQQLTDNANKTTVNDFADAKARSGSSSYIYTCVPVKSKQSGLLEVFLQKLSGDYGSGHHTCAVDSNGVSRAYDVDPSDKTSLMLTLLAYRDYFLFFPSNHSYKLTVQRIDAKPAAQPLFRSPHAIRPNKAVYKSGNSSNYNRNVQLEGDMLYFIDTNCHVVQYNLKELLSSDGTVNPNYQPTVHKIVCEDLCVSPDNSTITVITEDGLLSQVTNPSRIVDLKTLESGKLGTQYGTIETLGGYYVVASYNDATQSIVYSVFSAQLEFLSFAAKPSANQMVQNMLLYQRQDTLHILAANEANAVDLLLFNDTTGKVKVHLIQSLAVSSSYLRGLVWRVESQEALLCGTPGVLKSLKLN